MTGVINTLFNSYRQVSPFFEGGVPRCVFLNARHHNDLKVFDNDILAMQQYFYPYAAELKAKNYQSTPVVDVDFFDGHKSQNDLCMILLPQNHEAAVRDIKIGLSLINDDGIIICAAENKAGGARLPKTLKAMGVKSFEQLSKNKARAVWFSKSNMPNTIEDIDVREYLSPQCVEAHPYKTYCGIYGWDKIDVGSELLAQHFDGVLHGRGADLGCGYGYLSIKAMEKNESIESLICIDADYRSIVAAQHNLRSFDCMDVLWDDITKPYKRLKNLDFVIMNPPFHRARNTDIEIGISFINYAAEILKNGGVLYMVSNSQLPYEHYISKAFNDCEILEKKSGFKILCCNK